MAAKQSQAEIQAELEKHMADPMWRICNLYKIIVKKDEGEDGKVIQFSPNRAQRRFIKRLWHRNLILKARQLGFTTLIAILWLDYALFNPNVRCGIIAQDKPAAETIFRDKVKFAYENLPPELLAVMPLKADNASELLFAHNNSSIRVATSLRSGTTDRLHISEFGKICAKFPDKAKEVITGSIPSVPDGGILIIESTAEGEEGDFHAMVQRAMAMRESGKKLTSKDYRFHFFAWWDNPEYEMDPAGVPMTEKDNAYFNKIEAEIGLPLNERKRAWYVATRDSDFVENPEAMWQEYPGTPGEAFQVSTEGCYYSTQLADARKAGRICHVPRIDLPVYTFWDIGNSDMTAIWFMQKAGLEFRFIRYYEASGETLAHYIKYLQDTGYIWAKHFLPHDAAHKRLSDTNKSIKEMLEDLKLTNIEIVPRITDELTGINMTRASMSQCIFDEVGTMQGVKRLAGFKKAWNKQTGSWKPTPRLNDENNHGADAFRQFAQALNGNMIQGMVTQRPRRPSSGSWRSA
jgi:hypothetical protein